MSEPMDVYDGVAKVGQALASGTRLKLVELLIQAERPVSDLADLAGVNLTTASAHLQVLREAGLVRSRRAGRQIFYRVSDDDVAALAVQLALVAERHRPAVAADLAAALPADELHPMGREDLIAASQSGAVVVLDVRPSDEYAAWHLDGAVSIPLGELADRLDELPPDAEIVAYCRGRYCVLSHQAAALLRSVGREASAARDGVAEWVAAGRELDRRVG